MRSTFCTLFNSKYLDKGLALYKSLEKVCDHFRLYILAMDDTCFNVLNDLNLPYTVPVKLSDFENDDLLQAKANRSFPEYCWTCASSFVKYVIDTYNPPCCTYLDADEYFFSNPSILLDEMFEKKGSVLITAHRFDKRDKYKEKKVGKYCVEFNTFLNNHEGRTVLNHWVDLCIKDCSKKDDGIHYGDQLYLNNWISDYPFVVETEHLGAGIAPWNIGQYQLPRGNKSFDGSLIIGGKEINMVFYHFERIEYLSEVSIKMNVDRFWEIDTRMLDAIYRPYLQELQQIQIFLKSRYNLSPILLSHPDKKSFSNKLHNLNIYRFFMKIIYRKNNILTLE